MEIVALMGFDAAHYAHITTPTPLVLNPVQEQPETRDGSGFSVVGKGGSAVDLTQYGRLFGIQAVLIALLVLVFSAAVVAIVAARREAGVPRRRAVRRAAVASVAVLGACLTWLVALTPSAFAGMGREIEWNPVDFTHAGDPIAVSHLVGNLLMLTWVGLCAPALWRRLTWIGTIGLVAAVSLTVEAIQFVTALGRVASTQDLVMNVVGGALAAVVGVVYVRPWVEIDRAH